MNALWSLIPTLLGTVFLAIVFRRSPIAAASAIGGTRLLEVERLESIMRQMAKAQAELEQAEKDLKLGREELERAEVAPSTRTAQQFAHP